MNFYPNICRSFKLSTHPVPFQNTAAFISARINIVSVSQGKNFLINSFLQKVKEKLLWNILQQQVELCTLQTKWPIVELPQHQVIFLSSECSRLSPRWKSFAFGRLSVLSESTLQCENMYEIISVLHLLFILVRALCSVRICVGNIFCSSTSVCLSETSMAEVGYYTKNRVKTV